MNNRTSTKRNNFRGLMSITPSIGVMFAVTFMLLSLYVAGMAIQYVRYVAAQRDCGFDPIILTSNDNQYFTQRHERYIGGLISKPFQIEGFTCSEIEAHKQGYVLNASYAALNSEEADAFNIAQERVGQIVYWPTVFYEGLSPRSAGYLHDGALFEIDNEVGQVRRAVFHDGEPLFILVNFVEYPNFADDMKEAGRTDYDEVILRSDDALVWRVEKPEGVVELRFGDFSFHETSTEQIQQFAVSILNSLEPVNL